MSGRKMSASPGTSQPRMEAPQCKVTSQKKGRKSAIFVPQSLWIQSKVRPRLLSVLCRQKGSQISFECKADY